MTLPVDPLWSPNDKLVFILQSFVREIRKIQRNWYLLIICRDYIVKTSRNIRGESRGIFQSGDIQQS